MIQGLAAARASSLIKSAIAWDNHACMPLRAGDFSFLPQLQRHADAGFDVVVLNIGFGDYSYAAHLEMLSTFVDWLSRHADRFTLARSVSDIESARGAGKLAVCFDVEGMGILDDGALGKIGLLRELGVLWMLVAYNKGNRSGGGCHDENDQGLTTFGREALKEMKRVGVIACCSHTGPRTALEVMEAADNPVIFSHSNARAVWNHPRNISDALARAAAETGGVIGVNGIGLFLGDNDTSTEAIVRHIDHFVQLIGPAHVGLGLDYVFDGQELTDFITAMPETFPGYDRLVGEFGMIGPERLNDIVEALLARGYGEAAVKAIIGGNWLRVVQQVWRDPSGEGRP